MSNVTPIGQSASVDLPSLSHYESASSTSLTAAALEDSQEAFKLFASQDLRELERMRACGLLARTNDRLRVLAARMSPERVREGDGLARYLIEAGARLRGVMPPTIAAGWPSCTAMRDLPEHQRWLHYSSALMNRELLEYQGLQFEEAFDAFTARIVVELCL